MTVLDSNVGNSNRLFKASILAKGQVLCVMISKLALEAGKVTSKSGLRLDSLSLVTVKIFWFNLESLL
eukprot:02958.XXX_69999_70202_1 [CDS] Oithona nana genome sequencing.